MATNLTRRTRRGSRFDDHPIVRMQREMDNLFNQWLGTSPDHVGAAHTSARFTPSVDIADDGDALVVHAELPGMSADDVELILEDNMLTLRGEKRSEAVTEDDGVRHTERTFGSFTRSFSLPQGIDEDAVEAHFDRGVLNIRIPKVADDEQAPRRIAIHNGPRAHGPVEVTTDEEEQAS